MSKTVTPPPDLLDRLARVYLIFYEAGLRDGVVPDTADQWGEEDVAIETAA